MKIKNIFSKRKDPADKSRECKYCGDLLMAYDGKFIKGHEGEENWRGKKVYQCMKCRNERFCKMINSSPHLKTQYWNIHGESPEEALGMNGRTWTDERI